MSLYMLQGNNIKDISLGTLKRENLAKWWSWANEDTSESVDSLYGNVPWLYRGANAICGASVSVPRSLHKGDISGDVIEEEALNLQTPLGDLIDVWVGHLLFYGAFYGQIISNKYNVVRDIQVYAPATMKANYDSDGVLETFTRTVNGKEKKIDIDTPGFVYSWLPNRTAETGAGVPPVQAALAAAGVLRNIDAYASMYFKNGAVNPTLISVDGSSQMQDVDRERLKSWYKRMLGSIKNAFGIEVVNGKVTATTIGYALKDLATTELTASKREDVSTALGVPQTLLFSNAANYATAAQDDLHLYEKTVKPLLNRVKDTLNKRAFKPMGIYLACNFEQMEIYQQQKQQQADALAVLVNSKILDTNEAREELGYEARAEVVPPPEPQTPELPANVQTNDGESMTIDETVMPIKTHVHIEKESPALTDLNLWQTVAIKRLKEGKLAKALDFESAVIRPTLMASIKGALEAVNDATDIKHIFADAMEWASYP